MSTTYSPVLNAVLAGIVVFVAGVAAFLQSSLGGPGTLAFDVRLLLVLVAGVGALILGQAVRTLSGSTGTSHLSSA
jgi:hypothetical protein